MGHHLWHEVRSANRSRLLLLDAVLHVAARAIELLVEILRIAFQVGDDVARVGSLWTVLDTRDHPALGVPGAGCVGKLAEQALLEACAGEALSRRLHPRRGQIVEPRVLGQTDDVADTLALAPGQHLVAAEAAIPSQDDAHTGPRLAEPFDQQRQDRPGMLGSIDLRRAQITDQQALAAEHIKRQETVMIVVAVEEAANLAPVHRVVGGVEVEESVPRGPLNATR